MMRGMNKSWIEPGLLSLFRLNYALLLLWDGSELLGLMDGSSLIRLVVNGEHYHNQYALWSFLNILNAVIMLFVLLSDWLPRHTGQWYLPIAVLIASINTILAQWIEITRRISQDIPLESLNLFALLFIPMLIVTVQYGFRGTLGFVLATSVFQLMLALFFIPLDRPAIGVVGNDVLIRAMTYPFAGFIVGRLVGGQKTERKTLTEQNIELARYALAVERLAISQERNRLARELHDTLAHTLSAVAVQLEAHDAQLESDPEEAKQTLKQSRLLVRDGLQEARRAVQALRARPLEDLGLVRAMQHLVDSMTERSGLPIALDIVAEFDELSPEIEQAIYRITEEALNNIIRHANAQRAEVSLRRELGELRLEIADDGYGFNLKAVPSEGHYGLKGMRERALLCNGHLEIQSTPTTGTTVRLTVKE